jgi:mannose-6-phosphate isomerase-like protein (cupin superfamily)
MKYFIDLDNTLCYTQSNDYKNSKPNVERINYLRDLKDSGHHITIWTARGSSSGLDHSELTKTQLAEWNVPYDELVLGKPSYDCCIDDKSFNVDDYWCVPPPPNSDNTDNTDNTVINKKIKSEVVIKGWGKEIVFVNNGEYCGKILSFEKGKKFSMHYHLLKKETWYVSKGRFIFIWIETSNGTKHSEYLEVGDVVTNERGEPHQLIALEDADIFEVSTQHFDTDSYRIWKGN